MDITEKPRVRVRAGTAADIRRELTKTADKISDLMDTVDVPAVSDMFNAADHGNRPRTPTGPAESMSGSGSERMIEHYSPDQQPGNSIAQAYDSMAAQLSFMNRRMAASEAAIKSIATWLAQQAGVKSFPADEEKADESDEKEDDEDEAMKSIPTMGIPQLFAKLANVSRDTGKVGIQNPPDMAVIKAGGNKLQELLDADDGRRFPFHARMELQSIQHAIANNDGGQLRGQHLSTVMGRASPEAKLALSMAGII